MNDAEGRVSLLHLQSTKQAPILFNCTACNIENAIFIESFGNESNLRVTTVGCDETVVFHCTIVDATNRAYSWKRRTDHLTLLRPSFYLCQLSPMRAAYTGSVIPTILSIASQQSSNLNAVYVT